MITTVPLLPLLAPEEVVPEVPEPELDVEPLEPVLALDVEPLEPVLALDVEPLEPVLALDVEPLEPVLEFDVESPELPEDDVDEAADDADDALVPVDPPAVEDEAADEEVVEDDALNVLPDPLPPLPLAVLDGLFGLEAQPTPNAVSRSTPTNPRGIYLSFDPNEVEW